MNVQMLSDQMLLQNYLQGDRSAISTLIDKHSRRVRDYIRMMVKDNDVADDIFQETFIKVVNTIDQGPFVGAAYCSQQSYRLFPCAETDTFRKRVEFRLRHPGHVALCRANRRG